MGSRETTPSTDRQPNMPTNNIILVANRTRRQVTEKNYSLWGGGSTTVVSPDTSNGDVILAEMECVPSVVKYKVQNENTSRPRASKRRAEEDLVDPEEDAKRKMRRNRNRLAAAKCRQKRLDQIADLQVEVSKWEMKNRSLEEEVAALREEKEELQYILATHRNTCTLQVKVEEEEESQSPVLMEQITAKPQRPVSLSLTPVTVK